MVSFTFGCLAPRWHVVARVLRAREVSCEADTLRVDVWGRTRGSASLPEVRAWGPSLSSGFPVCRMERVSEIGGGADVVV